MKGAAPLPAAAREEDPPPAGEPSVPPPVGANVIRVPPVSTAPGTEASGAPPIWAPYSALGDGLGDTAAASTGWACTTAGADTAAGPATSVPLPSTEMTVTPVVANTPAANAEKIVLGTFPTVAP
ncbi:hypothetical protein MYFR107205_21595 [Mycolicibacterium frederiksbergense]